MQLHEIWDIIGHDDKTYYSPDQLIKAAIHLLTGMSDHRTYRETGVDKVTLHWMKVGIWHRDSMLKAYNLLSSHKIKMKQSRIDAIM